MDRAHTVSPSGTADRGDGIRKVDVEIHRQSRRNAAGRGMRYPVRTIVRAAHLNAERGTIRR
jgi:hypothetical protein